LSDIKFYAKPKGGRLAYRIENAGAPGIGIVWLGGFRSDMAGTKAEAVAALAREKRWQFLRFDYSGHGASDGVFSELTLTDWLDDAVTILLQVAQGAQLIVGSSMGGYIALLLARRLRQEYPHELARLKGMVLIAPAADMTEALFWANFSEQVRQQIETSGEWEMSSPYGEGYVVTRRLIEDGRQHLVLGQHMPVNFPVDILHGEDDPDVPWQHGLKVYAMLKGEDVSFTLIKGGDHRLSTPRDLRLITQTIEKMLYRVDLRASNPSR
jgi:pimeloyl-ACP methyl ester carboxylesterase